MLSVNTMVAFLSEVGYVCEVVEAMGQDKAIVLLNAAGVFIKIEFLAT